MNKLLRWKFWQRYLVCGFVGHVWNDHKIRTCRRCGCSYQNYIESISGEKCEDCEKYFDCGHSQALDDWCSEFESGNQGWYWTVAMMAIGLIVFLLFVSGCTDRVHYQHGWIDPNGTPQSIVVDYSEGVGNSDKQAIILVLPDGAYMSVGRSMTDQDEFMGVLRQYGITLEKLADAWLKEQVF